MPGENTIQSVSLGIKLDIRMTQTQQFDWKLDSLIINEFEKQLAAMALEGMWEVPKESFLVLRWQKKTSLSSDKFTNLDIEVICSVYIVFAEI